MRAIPRFLPSLLGLCSGVRSFPAALNHTKPKPYYSTLQTAALETGLLTNTPDFLCASPKEQGAVLGQPVLLQELLPTPEPPDCSCGVTDPPQCQQGGNPGFVTCSSPLQAELCSPWPSCAAWRVPAGTWPGLTALLARFNPTPAGFNSTLGQV